MFSHHFGTVCGGAKSQIMNVLQRGKQHVLDDHDSALTYRPNRQLLHVFHDIYEIMLASYGLHLQF